MLNAPAHTAPKASGMGAKEKKTAMPASELSVASHERRQQAAPLDIGLAANLASASTSNEKDQLAGKPWYIVMPDDAIVKGRDLFVVVALLCLAMVTPWELAFARAAGGVDFLFCFNRGIDCAFVFDILIQFFISRELVEPPQDIGVKKATPLEKFERQKQLLGTGRPRTYYDFRIKSIAWSYLTGMFLFDLLAMLPSVFDVVEVVTYYMTLGEDSDDSNLSLLRGSKAAKLAKMTSSSKMMKMMRISRVMKLVRLLNSFEKLKEIEMQLLNYLYEHKRKVTLLKLLLLNSYIVHILACVVGYTINFNDDKLGSFWGRHGWCFPFEESKVATQIDQPLCADMWTEYWILYHWALGATLGLDTAGYDQGPGDPYYRQGDNAYFTSAEHVVFTVCAVMGAGWGLYITGIFVNVLTEAGETPTEQVTAYAIDKSLHWVTTRALQEYCQEQEELEQKIPAETNFIYNLSPRLIEDMMLQVHGVWLMKLPFANYLLYPPDVFTTPGPKHGLTRKAVERSAMPFLAKLALSMRPALFVPSEHPPPYRLYVIVKGSAIPLHGGRTLQEGDNWGVVDTLLHNKTPSRVRAVAYLHTCYITADDLGQFADDEEVAPAYASLKKWVLIQNCCYAIHRHRKKFNGQVDPTIVESLEKKRRPPDGGAGGLVGENAQLRAEVERLRGVVSSIGLAVGSEDTLTHLAPATSAATTTSFTTSFTPPHLSTPQTGASYAPPPTGGEGTGTGTKAAPLVGRSLSTSSAYSSSAEVPSSALPSLNVPSPSRAASGTALVAGSTVSPRMSSPRQLPSHSNAGSNGNAGSHAYSNACRPPSPRSDLNPMSPPVCTSTSTLSERERARRAQVDQKWIQARASAPPSPRAMSPRAAGQPQASARAPAAASSGRAGSQDSKSTIRV